MPTVPMLNTAPVQERPLQTTPLNPLTPIDAYGGGRPAERLLDAQNNFSSSLTKFAVEEKQKADDLVTTDLYTQASRMKQHLLYGENGLYSLRGKDAFGAADTIGQKWDEALSGLQAQTTNNDQVASFQKISAHLSNDLQDDIEKHTYVERKSFDDNTTLSALAAAKDNATLKADELSGLKSDQYLSPQTAVGQNYQTMLEIIDQKAARDGIEVGSPIYHQLKQEYTGAFHASVASRLMGLDRDGEAKDYFNLTKGEMTAQQIDVIGKAVEESSLRGSSQRLSDSLLKTSKDENEALQKIKTIEDPKLRDETERRVTKDYAQQNQAIKQGQESLYNQGVQSIIQNPGKEARDVVDPTVYANLPPNLREALDRQAQNVPNDNHAWLDYLHLTPKERGSLSPTDYAATYQSRFDLQHRNEADTMYKAASAAVAKGEHDPSLAGIQNYTTQTLSLAKQYGFIPEGKLNTSQATLLTDIHQAANDALGEFQAKNARKATYQEQQGILHDLMKQKVYESPGFFFGKGKALPAGVAKIQLNDANKSAYVPQAEIPSPDLNSITAHIQSSGTKVTKDKVQRAYAAYLMNDLDRYKRVIGE